MVIDASAAFSAMRGGLLCRPVNLDSGARLILRPRTCPILLILVPIDYQTLSGQPFRYQSKESPEGMILTQRSGSKISVSLLLAIYYRSQGV